MEDNSVRRFRDSVQQVIGQIFSGIDRGFTGNKSKVTTKLREICRLQNAIVEEHDARKALEVRFVVIVENDVTRGVFRTFIVLCFLSFCFRLWMTFYSVSV
jgi:hypothetical protein